MIATGHQDFRVARKRKHRAAQADVVDLHVPVKIPRYTARDEPRRHPANPGCRTSSAQRKNGRANDVANAIADAFEAVFGQERSCEGFQHASHITSAYLAPYLLCQIDSQVDLSTDHPATNSRRGGAASTRQRNLKPSCWRE